MSATFASSLLFARSFLKNPMMLGSFIPSSKYLIRALMRHINWDETRVLVEYGPGVGTITGEMLSRLRADGVLIAIERNPDFVDFLRSHFQDERLYIHSGSAEDVDQVIAKLGYAQADCIISGIPYSTLPAPVREAILHRSRKVLRPGGMFLVYQFTTAVVKHMRRTFGAIKQEREVRNILPARIFVARKDTVVAQK